MEWLDPVYCSGHWVPQMVEIAGGWDALGRTGADSVRIPWEHVLQWAPEILIIMPCGFGLEKAAAVAPQLFAYPGWRSRICGLPCSARLACPGQPQSRRGTRSLPISAYARREVLDTTIAVVARRGEHASSARSSPGNAIPPGDLNAENDRADGRASFLRAPDTVAPPVALEPDNSPYRSSETRGSRR